MRVASGEFLPHDDPRSARAFAVLGSKVARELFGGENPLGAACASAASATASSA